MGSVFYQRMGHQTEMKHFGIAPEHVLARDEVENGTITDRVIRIPSGKGKPRAINEVIGRIPDAVFGNSTWDFDVLEIARYPFPSTPQRNSKA